MTITSVSTPSARSTEYLDPTSEKRNAAMPTATAAAALSNAPTTSVTAAQAPADTTWPDNRRVPLWGSGGILTPSLMSQSGPADTDVSTMSVADRLRAMQKMESLQQAGDSSMPSAMPPSTSAAWKLDVQA